MENEQFKRTTDDEQRLGADADGLDPLHQVAELLPQVRQYVNEQLQGSTYMAVRLRLDNQLGQMIGFISGITGSPVGGSGSADSIYGAPALADLNQPLTRMLGMDIDRPRPVQPQHLLPTSDEAARFRERTVAMADTFLARTDEDLLAGTKVPGTEATLRAVAKHAGHEHYRDAPMDLVFIQTTRQLLQEKRSVTTAEQLAQATGTRPVGSPLGITVPELDKILPADTFPADVPRDSNHLEALHANMVTEGTGSTQQQDVPGAQPAGPAMDPQHLVPGDGLPAGTESTGSTQQGTTSTAANGSGTTETGQPAEGETVGGFKPATGSTEPDHATGKKSGPGRPPKNAGPGK